MGKQGFDPRTALANALNTSGKAKAAPPKKEVVKEVPISTKKKVEKPAEPDPAPKTKKDLEEDQRRYVEQFEAEKQQFFASEQARKLAGSKGVDQEVTYVEDKDTRKPKAVSDISDFWKKELGLLPYMPTDNVQEVDLPEELDHSIRLLYLQNLNEQLEKLLTMRFHVFWSQCIYDPAVSRLVDSYLRYCLRSHDLVEGQEPAISLEEMTASRDVSRRMFQLLLRLSRPQESPHEFLSKDKFAQVIHEHQLFDVPKIIDLCVIYGDANRNTVTKIVHSVFKHQPLFKEEFASVVQHMLDGLLQCCAPLQLAAKGSSSAGPDDLSVMECKAFLPDMLSCFNAIFCFFPEECVEKLMGGSLKIDSAGNDAGVPALPLADLMVILHDAVSALRDKDSNGKADMDSIIKLLSRLLSCVLGFRMAPRHGADAFGELVAWVTEHAERTQLIQDLSRNGLDNVAMEWIASGLVDDTQLDYLDDLCGAPLLPKEARHRRRPVAPGAAKAAPRDVSGPSSSSSSSNDRAKIREVREVVGSEYGEGFILQCLLHYGGSVPQAVGGILDGSLPPQIKALPIGMSIGAETAAAEQPSQSSLSAEDKQLILNQADRIEGSDVEVEKYNDDYDDEEAVGMPRLAAGAASDWEDRSEEEEEGSSDEGPQWSNDRMRGGRLKGKGKGKAKSSGPTQGQTLQARRKEAHKAQVANHNRRDAAMRKMARGL